MRTRSICERLGRASGARAAGARWRSAAVLGLALALACAGTAPGSEGPLFAPAPGSPLALPGAPAAVLPGDLDRDGKADLVAACSTPVGVQVLRGDGAGRFAPAEPIPVDLPAAPTEFVLADLDGDGCLDFAGATHDSHDVIVLWGDGRGGLAPRGGARFAAGGEGRPHAHGLLAHDLTGDGKLDLLLVQSSPSNRLAVLRNDGRRGFAAAPELGAPLERGAYPSALATLDGDRWLDLASPAMESEPPVLRLLRGRAGGGFEAEVRDVPLAIARPYHAAAGDLDGDGDQDLAVTHDDTSLATLLLNDGAGAFSESAASPLELGARGGAILVADLDGDGRRDLVTVGSSALRIFLSDGRGGFAPAPGSPIAVPRGSWRLALADLDGDGRADVVTCGVEVREIGVLLHR